MLRHKYPTHLDLDQVECNWAVAVRRIRFGVAIRAEWVVRGREGSRG